MSPASVQHFLVVYDIHASHAEVESFGTDYEAALSSYETTEAEYREDPNIEVVLLGSDSIGTLQRTHSSYFRLSEKHIDQMIGRELAELGLR
jgi:hypothetical protein